MALTKEDKIWVRQAIKEGTLKLEVEFEEFRHDFKVMKEAIADIRRVMADWGPMPKMVENHEFNIIALRDVTIQHRKALRKLGIEPGDIHYDL